MTKQLRVLTADDVGTAFQAFEAGTQYAKQQGELAAEGAQKAAQALEGAEERIERVDTVIADVQSEWAGIKVDTAQSTTEALAVTGIDPAYISETEADPPLGPDGTRGAKRTSTGGLVRLERVAGAWVTRGAALPGRSEVEAVEEAARLATPDRLASRDGLRVGPLGVPEMQPGHRESRGGRRVLLERPRGMADAATGFAVQVGEANPRTQIGAMPDVDYMAQYTDRDATGALINIVAPPSPVLTDTTYTATTLVSPSANWDYAAPGDYVRVEDGAAVYTGMIQAVDRAANRITVLRGWVRHGSYDAATKQAQFGTPTSGARAILSPVSKVWATNTNVYLYPNSYARKAAVVEAGLFNEQVDHDDGFDGDLQGPYSWGYDIVSLGSKRGGVGAIVREHWHTGMLVRGADTFGYRTMRHPNPAWNPDYAFAALAGEPVALLSRNNPDGVRGEFETASGLRQLYRLGYGEAGNRVELDLGNVRMSQSLAEPGVVRSNAAALIIEGNLRGEAFWVGEKRVVGERQAAIPPAASDTDSLRNVVNAIRTVLQNHGLTEVYA